MAGWRRSRDAANAPHLGQGKLAPLLDCILPRGGGPRHRHRQCVEWRQGGASKSAGSHGVHGQPSRCTSIAHHAPHLTGLGVPEQTKGVPTNACIATGN